MNNNTMQYISPIERSVINLKCPKCKKEVKEVCIGQEFTTSALGIMNEKGEKTFDDLEAGYTLLEDWLYNMLNEKGKPEIVGCENCIGKI